MGDLLIIALVYFIFAIVFVVWRAILQNKRKKEMEKEFVVKFLWVLFPDSATSTEIADYTGLSFLRVLDILCCLIKDNRVQEEGSGYISTELGNKRYPPKLRLVK